MKPARVTKLLRTIGESVLELAAELELEGEDKDTPVPPPAPPSPSRPRRRPLQETPREAMPVSELARERARRALRRAGKA